MGDNQTNINYKTLKNYFTIVAFTNIHFASSTDSQVPDHRENKDYYWGNKNYC